LPIKREHREAITPRFADITNSSSGDKFGGASQAAAFLESFIEKPTNWVHLDIAGPGISNRCGTGFATQLVLNYILTKNEKEQKSEVSEVVNQDTSYILKEVDKNILRYYI